MKLKNKIKLLGLLFIFIILFLSNKTFAANTIDIKVNGTMDYTKAWEVLKIVNEERKAAGFEELEMDTELQEVAMIRAAEIALNFEHTRPDGTLCFSICSKLHGENIACGMTDASVVMDKWMNSEGHKANILNKGFKSIGIGCFKNGNVYYWVQNFSYNDSTLKSSTTGTQNATFNVPIINENLKIYARKVSNFSNLYIGDKGSYIYGIYNKSTDFFYCVGDADDYTFTSSNQDVIKINLDGTFSAVGKGTSTITITLKANPAVNFSEDITVKPLEPEKITGLKAQNQKTTTLEITWDAQFDTADRYEVAIYNSKKKKYETIGTISINAGTIYNIQSGTTYKFKVRALRTINGKTYYGPYSDVLKTTTATDKTNISKIKGDKKKLTINWKKVSKATGYQVQVATDKKFVKNKKSITISKNKTISTIIKNLKSKKKYYVRVRTYRKVGGKKVYSSWSTVKNIKTK